MQPIATPSQRAMFVFICFVWGTTWLAMKVGIQTVSPGVFAGLRWSLAGVVLLAVRRYRGERVVPPPRLLPRLLFVSVLLITLNQVIQLYGLRYITAGLAAVISSALTPIALLGFSVALGQERFSPRQAAAILVGVVGVFMLFGPAALAGRLDLRELAGAGGVTLGCLCYCFGSVMTRPMMRTLQPVQLAGLTGLIGGLILLLASLVFEPGAWQSMRLHWGWPAFLAWLYLLGPGALLSTSMYFLLVRDWGASRPGTYAFISPVIAVAIGCGLFGEKLDWGSAVGMTLMLGAAGLALRPASPRFLRLMARPVLRAGSGRGFQDDAELDPHAPRLSLCRQQMHRHRSDADRVAAGEGAACDGVPVQLETEPEAVDPIADNDLLWRGRS